MSEKTAFVSFPEGYLGRDPIKLDLLANTDDYFALNKPGGVATAVEPWTLGKPDLGSALRRQLLEGKPQLKRLAIDAFSRIYPMDPEVSGVALFAKSALAEEFLRNELGSRKMEFIYELLVEPDTGEKQLMCELPLAKHVAEPRMIVSHSTGKKTSTTFAHRESYGRYHLWEARTSDFRPHQIRIHAVESGLRIVGEALYATSRPILLSQLKRGYRSGRRAERPLYDGLCLHLKSVSFQTRDGVPVTVTADRPTRFDVVIKKLIEAVVSGGHG